MTDRPHQALFWSWKNSPSSSASSARTGSRSVLVTLAANGPTVYRSCYKSSRPSSSAFPSSSSHFRRDGWPPRVVTGKPSRPWSNFDESPKTTPGSKPSGTTSEPKWPFTRKSPYRNIRTWGLPVRGRDPRPSNSKSPRTLTVGNKVTGDEPWSV